MHTLITPDKVDDCPRPLVLYVHLSAICAWRSAVITLDANVWGLRVEWTCTHLHQQSPSCSPTIWVCLKMGHTSINGSVITGNMVTDPKGSGVPYFQTHSLTGESQDRDRCDGQTFSWRDHHAPWPCRKVGTGDHGLDHRMLRRKSQPFFGWPPTIPYKPLVIGLVVWLPSYLTDWRARCL